MMKYVWKLMIAICAAALLCACGPDTEPFAPAETREPVVLPEPTVSQGAADKALETFRNVIKAETPEQLAPYVAGADDARLLQLISYYPKGEGQVDIRYSGTCDGYDLFSYDLRYDGETFEKGILMMVEENDQYKICMDPQVHEQMRSKLLCGGCGGAGGAYNGGMICAICGGSGQQLIPGAWYDGNMWHDQWIGCGGCGGSGRTGGSWATCPFCGGTGVDFS